MCDNETDKVKENDNVFEAWKRYQEFEEFVYCGKPVTITHFLAEWRRRLKRAVSAGCRYSHCILGFKLLEQANLQQEEILEVLTVVQETCWPGREKILQNILTYLETKQRDTNNTKPKNYAENNIVPESVKEEALSQDNFDIDSNYQDADSELEEKYLHIFSEKDEESFRKEEDDNVEIEGDSTLVSNPANSKSTAAANTHQLSTHSRYPCSHCPASFATRSKFVRHLKAFHPDLVTASHPGQLPSSHPEQLTATPLEHRTLSPLEQPTTPQPEQMPTPTLQDVTTSHPDVQLTTGGRKRKRHTCPDCDFCAATAKLYRQHVAATGHKNTGNIVKKRAKDDVDCQDLVCTYCGFTAASKKSVINHCLAEHEGVRYPCHLCQYKGKSMSTLKQHVKSVHEGIKYPCDQCTYMATALNALRRHIRSVHEGEKFPCDSCHYQATDSSTLKKHKQFKHEGVRYPCDQCAYQATTAQALRIHIKYIHEGERIPCEQCGYLAAGPGRLRSHIKTVHQGVRYCCDKCDYAAKTRSLLRHHRQNKHEGVKYPCTLCDYLAPTNSALVTHHKSIHEGVRHPCSHCNHSATTLSSLKLHVKVHHSEGTIPCSQCTFMATSEGRLRKHVKAVHEGKKYFQCDMCDVMCTKSCNLKTHKKLKHAVGYNAKPQ